MPLFSRKLRQWLRPSPESSTPAPASTDSALVTPDPVEMMEPVHAPPTTLSNLRWVRARVSLLNTRNKFGKAHPLFTIQALLFHARGLSSLGKNQTVLFRMSSCPGTRIKKDRLYRFDLFLPGRSIDEHYAFLHCLKYWLESGERNFQLQGDPEVQERSLADLIEENPLDLTQPEIALDFQTPFSFNPKPEGGPYLPTQEQVRAMLTLRMAALTGQKEDECQPPQTDLTLLSYLDGFQSSRRLSSEQPGGPEVARKVKAISGVTGPLYLRGNWQPWLPWLLLAQEFTLGRCASQGQGVFKLSTPKPCSDCELPNLTRFEAAWEHFAGRDQLSEARTAPHVLTDHHQLLRDLVDDLKSARYQSDPAHSCQIVSEKKGTSKNGTRRIALLSRRDAVAHRVLHQILTPRWDRLHSHAVHGYRPRRSVETASTALRKALSKNAGGIILQTDIASFFDHLNWDLLDRMVDDLLPHADCATRHALAQAIRIPLLLGDGHPAPRKRGLVQGSALSPLLANLYLRAFDQTMAAGDHTYLRYGDDFLILTPSLAAAEKALQNARTSLQELGLTLSEEKTIITPAADGFTWLGQSFGGNSSQDTLQRAKMKRPLILRGPWGFIGLDHDSILFRRGNEVIDRIPLSRISQLILHGSFGLSSSLLHVCAKRKIPVVLCSPAGHHQRTLAGDEKANLSRLGHHLIAHRTLIANTHLAVARTLVEAKLDQYHAQIKRSRDSGKKDLNVELVRLRSLLPTAGNIESLRGYEGQAAHLSFRFFNDQVKVPSFQSPKRLPHEKPDRWNALLDFGYSQLFSSLNAALRAHGLNPFLGILHSADDRYESFTADLQEPFRARIDAWALRAVNLREVKPDDFAPHKVHPGHFQIDSQAFPRLLENFARELARTVSGDPGSFRDLLEAQVWLVRDWVEGRAPLRFWTPEA